MTDARLTTGPERYPLLLDLAGRLVVVVGGGAVATRRATTLIESGADVLVVAPIIDRQLARLPIRAVQRAYQSGDLAGAWLVHACTDDPAVNAAVAAEAERAHIFCVRADDATESAAWLPAVGRAEDITVAVGGGRDPGRAVAIRDAVTLLLRTGQLPVRRTRRPSETGSIALVGGGPGDPGLITVRGRHLLAHADVVVVDRLAPHELLRELAPDVEVIAVGKTPYTAGPTQEEINDLLVTRAAAGKRVVRLKGGDPFVFGRGGEEVLAAIAAGVPVEVVPGVTSATAVPAAAGIPVTHRGVAASFAVVTAHPGSPAEWDALARGPDTLIVLMGLRELPAIASQLIEHGRPADTPTAVISSGTTDRQRVVTGTLDTVAAQTAGLEPPALTVVGSVVGLRAALTAIPAASAPRSAAS